MRYITIILSLCVTFPAWAQVDSTCYMEYKEIRDRYLDLDNYQLDLTYIMTGGETGVSTFEKEVTIKKSGQKMHGTIGNTEVISTESKLLTIDHDKKLIILSKVQAERPELLTGMTSSLFNEFTKNIECIEGQNGQSKLVIKIEGSMVNEATITYNNSNHKMKRVEVSYIQGYGYDEDYYDEPVNMVVEYNNEIAVKTFPASEFDISKYCKQSGKTYQLTDAYKHYQFYDLSGDLVYNE